MLVAASLALILNSPSQAASYKIVDVARNAVFAGKLGDLVHETLTVEKDGQRYTITVRGDYHTACVRRSHRFQDGDQIRISSAISGSEATIDRERISIIRS
jgi:hypothetical protein